MAGPRYGRLRYDLLIKGLGMKDGDAIKLGVVGTADLIIYVAGNASYPLVDGAAATYGPDAKTPALGSIAFDTTNGLLFTCDSSSLWQQMKLN